MIINNTLTHGMKLGMFVMTYKLILFLLRFTFKKDYKMFNFLAGTIGAIMYSMVNKSNSGIDH